MKKILITLLLCVSIAYAQTVPAAQLIFSTITDLRAQSGTDNSLATLNGLSAKNDGNGGTYMWNASSTATEDGFTIVKVTNVTTGRWLRIGNGNTIKGQVTFVGALGVSTYTVNYPNGALPFVPIGVLITPRTSSGSYGYYIPTSGITNTGFTINYNTTLISILGALTGQTITFDFVVIKQ